LGFVMGEGAGRWGGWEGLLGDIFTVALGSAVGGGGVVGRLASEKGRKGGESSSSSSASERGLRGALPDLLDE